MDANKGWHVRPRTRNRGFRTPPSVVFVSQHLPEANMLANSNDFLCMLEGYECSDRFSGATCANTQERDRGRRDPDGTRQLRRLRRTGAVPW